jgi:hypothetical protein
LEEIVEASMFSKDTPFHLASGSQQFTTKAKHQTERVTLDTRCSVCLRFDEDGGSLFLKMQANEEMLAYLGDGTNTPCFAVSQISEGVCLECAAT